jgi:DNA-binding response OmpR family regulator
MEEAMTKTRILCIEDEREAAALIQEELSERGFEVQLAHDGQQGFAAILAEAPDLVLCDISMPIMSGFEVLERLTALAPRFRGMPFLFLTALGDRQNELQGRNMGADDYIIKPIDFDVLHAIVKARLARTPRVERWAEGIRLTQREIETVTWSARGKTSDEIAIILGVTKRTVDFHMDNARTKLGASTRTEAVVKAVTGKLIEP